MSNRKGLSMTEYDFVRLCRTGYVQDKYTNEPVVGVNVFIAGTLMGSSTNLDGIFKIENVAVSSFELAASHISYHIAISKVEITKDSSEVRVDFKLDPKVNQLKELKVVSLKYKEWEKYYSPQENSPEKQRRAMLWAVELAFHHHFPHQKCPHCQR